MIEATGVVPFNSDHIKLYYDRIFPFDLLFQWLSYSRKGNSHRFNCREFSMVVARGDEEFYIRWQSFQNGESFKKKILSMFPPPHKMDIGAIYNVPVSQKASIPLFIPVEKEIILDIDMNDYDDIRTCCKDKRVCQKCWKFLAVAMKLLETALRDDFGFQHIFWVFSGRRGVHCWVCDSKARKYSTEARGALADYLNIITGGANQKKKVQIYGEDAHPMIKRAYDLGRDLFDQLLEEQDFFHRGSKMEAIVDSYILSCKQTSKNRSKNTIKEEYDVRKQKWDGTSSGLWKIVLHVCNEFGDKTTPIELMLSFCYPRLDIHVTKDLGHLLKSPFCVHKATGLICIPLPPEERVYFNPSNAPSLKRVRDQFLERQSILQTELGPYIQYFQTEVLQPLLEDADGDDEIQKTIKNDQDSDAEILQINEFVLGNDVVFKPDNSTVCESLEW